ncbi:LCP family protein [Aestuariimicrobium soli]|uniref:LCP family protein n=1 Tax=Aestuariimicrobium soli TaxID=2035834 RepID=UPI003EBBD8C3
MAITTRRGLLSGIAGCSSALLTGALAACGRSTPDQPAPSPSETPSTGTPSPTTTPARPSSATSTPSPTPTPTPDALRPGVVNVLFLGNDSRTDNWSGRPDVIMVAQLSADRTDLTVVSICRDTYVSYSGGGSGKINAAHLHGGTNGLVRTVSNLLGGIEIHYVAQTGFSGFIAITRWLKGIPVVNRHATSPTVISTGRKVVFAKGRITIHGTDGLIYARERKSMPLGDLDRAERHRALMRGMITRLKQHQAGDAKAFGPLLTMLLKNTKVSGGITEKNLAGLVPALTQVDEQAMVSLQVPIARFALVKGESVNLVNTARTRELGAALKAGDVRAYVTKYGEGYAPGS